MAGYQIFVASQNIPGFATAGDHLAVVADDPVSGVIIENLKTRAHRTEQMAAIASIGLIPIKVVTSGKHNPGSKL